MGRDESHLFRQTMTGPRSELKSYSESLATPSLILETRSAPQNSDRSLRCKIAASERRQVKRQRRQYSADWKAKVALEAIKGQRTVQEIASHYEVHPTLVTHWKKQLLEGAAEIFSNGKRAAADADEELKAELYQQIGKLQVEVDWLKKKSGLSR
jgi:transposase